MATTAGLVVAAALLLAGAVTVAVGFGDGPVGLPRGAVALPGFSGCGPTYSRSPGGTVLPVKVLRPAEAVVVVVGVCFGSQGPYPFVVDTGSSTTVVNASLAARLKLRSIASEPFDSFGCSRRLMVAGATDLSVDGLPLQAQGVVVGTVSSPSLPALMGLLGSDVLSRFGAVRFDFAKSQLVVAGAEGPPQSSAKGTGHEQLSPALTAGTTASIAAVTAALAVPLGSEHGAGFLSTVHMYVPVSVGGLQAQELVVDTGAGITTVPSLIVSQAHLGAAGPSSVGYAGLDCQVTFSYYKVSSWKLGSFPLAATVIGTSNSVSIAAIGAATLARYSPVVIDYRDGDLLLRLPAGQRR